MGHLISTLRPDWYILRFRVYMDYQQYEIEMSSPLTYSDVVILLIKIQSSTVTCFPTKQNTILPCLQQSPLILHSRLARSATLMYLPSASVLWGCPLSTPHLRKTKKIMLIVTRYVPSKYLEWGADHLSKILDSVLAKGCTYWDTADVYDDNEILLAKWSVQSI